MDARSLLDSVAAAYAGLRTLAVGITSVTESGDEGSSSRNEHRRKAYFEAPDRVRLEQLGQTGDVTVCDGTSLSNYFARVKRFTKTTVGERRFLPGLFNPDMPCNNYAFLFQRVAENVAAAEMLPDQDGLRVVMVTYEHLRQLQPHHQSSPVTFRIDGESFLIARMECSTSHRIPTYDEVQTTKHTARFEGVVVNDPIAAGVFEYTPPAGAIDAPQGGSGFVGSIGGGGGIRRGGPGGTHETWHSTEWASEQTMVEHFRLTRGGLTFAFERRVTFSEKNSLEITERITGPKDPFECKFTVPLG